MSQLSFFQPAPAVTIDTPTPHHSEVSQAFRHALDLWYRHATEIKPEETGFEMPVTFADGRRGRVRVWFVE